MGNLVAGGYPPEVAQVIRDALRGDVVDLGCGPGSKVDPASTLALAECASHMLVQVDLRHQASSPACGYRLGANLNDPLPLGTERFDAVVCQHVVEHVRDCWGLTREVTRISKRGAVVLIAVPNGKSFSDAAFRLWYSLFHDIRSPTYDGHVQRFTKPALRSMIEQCGLRVRWVGEIEEAYSWLHKHPVMRGIATRLTRVFRRLRGDRFLYGWQVVATKD